MQSKKFFLDLPLISDFAFVILWQAKKIFASHTPSTAYAGTQKEPQQGLKAVQGFFSFRLQSSSLRGYGFLLSGAVFLLRFQLAFQPCNAGCGVRMACLYARPERQRQLCEGRPKIECPKPRPLTAKSAGILHERTLCKCQKTKQQMERTPDRNSRRW